MNVFRKSVLSLIFILFISPVLFIANAQSLTKGTYLAEPSNNSITIRWESDTKVNFLVKYGEDETLEESKEAKFIFTN